MQSNTRRKFITSFSVAPIVLAGKGKGAMKTPVTGSGEYTYEVLHDWGTLPDSIRYGNTHGVCVDAQGQVYIHHTVNASSPTDDTIVIFDSTGKYVRSWGKEFKGGAHGLTLNKEGSEEFLYLCDTKRAIVAKYTLNGVRVWEFGYPKDSPSYAPGQDGKLQKYSPTNLAIAPNGNIYVADGYGSSFINVYGPNGEWKFTFGGQGQDPGRLDCPHGITLDTRGAQPRLLVADRKNRRFQYFDLNGKHLGFAAIGDVKLPCHFDQRAGLLLVPDLEARVTLMDSSDKVLAQLGEDDSNTWGELRKQPRDKFVSGKFICPHGACFDKDGNIFVVEWVEVGRVTKLRRTA
jgi:hypothetical protein